MYIYLAYLVPYWLLDIDVVLTWTAPLGVGLCAAPLRSTLPRVMRAKRSEGGSTLLRYDRRSPTQCLREIPNGPERSADHKNSHAKRLACPQGVQCVPQNVQPTDEPFGQRFDIAEDKRLLYAMLLQVIPY
ncbi:MAG TPA: hypothetical protein VFR47_00195 [Anaerolineales bacterium]|nr:hypothetical protein [Anaerolineales bacterium]